MLGNLSTEVETEDNKNMVLQKDTEDGTSKQKWISSTRKEK